jgi:hypothetical protein
MTTNLGWDNNQRLDKTPESMWRKKQYWHRDELMKETTENITYKQVDLDLNLLSEVQLNILTAWKTQIMPREFSGAKLLSKARASVRKGMAMHLYCFHCKQTSFSPHCLLAVIRKHKSTTQQHQPAMAVSHVLVGNYWCLHHFAHCHFPIISIIRRDMFNHITISNDWWTSLKLLLFDSRPLQKKT